MLQARTERSLFSCRLEMACAFVRGRLFESAIADHAFLRSAMRRTTDGHDATRACRRWTRATTIDSHRLLLKSKRGASGDDMKHWWIGLVDRAVGLGAAGGALDHLRLHARSAPAAGDMYFGEVSGVAVNSKGHVFVLSRGNTSGPAYAAAAAQLLEFDPNGHFIREIGKNLYAWSFAHTVKSTSKTTSGLPTKAPTRSSSSSRRAAS